MKNGGWIFLFLVLLRRKYSITMNKFKYKITILAAVIFLLTGTGLAVFPNALAEGNIYDHQVADHGNEQSIHTDGYDIDQQAVHNSVSSFRVLFQRVLQQCRGRLTPFHWLSGLNIFLCIFSIVFSGGAFWLFLFYNSQPNQFCVKLNITHKSDGKKRPL